MRKQDRKLFQMAARIPRGIETKEGPDLETQIKAIRDEIILKVGGNADQVRQMQVQLDALDAKVGQRYFGTPIEAKTLVTHFKENPSFERLLADKRGRAVLVLEGQDSQILFGRKTTLTSPAMGYTTSGVMPVGRLDGVTAEARQALTLRDLLTATPTTFQVLDFVKVSAPMTIASPVAEASQKPENAATFTTVSERVKTIATWIPATRQVLDDMSTLAAFVNNSLTYYVNLEEELQMLSGDATGENLHGLIPQATAFSVGLLSNTKGWNKIDIIARAIQQITAAKELQPTFVAMHPNDWWDARLTKDGFGRYILGDPQQLSLTMNVFGLSVVSTVNIAQGSFLVGSGSPVATEIADRMETIVEVSTEHSDFFTKNLVAVRAEKRLALITRRPGSFITGTFTSSPA